MSEIETLKTKLTIALNELAVLKEKTSRRDRILDMVQQALSQLRLDMKYLLFDLEATRRERDHYKNKLENK